MITAKPTEHLTGITLEGEFQDFYEIVDSIHRMTGLEEDYEDFYWGVKNRLLGICYDIRHAYQGDRNIEVVENGTGFWGMNRRSLPTHNVHVSVEILFPEAVFVAMAVSEIYLFGAKEYGVRAKRKENSAGIPALRYSDYVRDCALLDWLSATILQAFAEVIGEEEFEKLMRFRERCGETCFMKYVTHYVDKCNVDYLKTDQEKRPAKLRNIVRRMLQKPAAYDHLKEDLEYWADVHQCNIYELSDPQLVYPEEIEW